MVQAFSVGNFKPFNEKGIRLELKPVTLLYGLNSGGKSSLLQAIMYLDEVMRGGTGDVSRPRMGGRVVDLGGFARLVHRYETSRRIWFELEWGEDNLGDWSLGFAKGHGDVKLRLEVGQTDERGVVLTKVEVQLGGIPILSGARTSTQKPFRTKSGGKRHAFWATERIAKATSGALEFSFSSMSVEVQAAEPGSESIPGVRSVMLDRAASLLDGLRRHMMQWLDPWRYLGPLRVYPERADFVQLHMSAVGMEADPSGAGAWRRLILDEVLRNDVNRELEQMEAPCRLELERFYRENAVTRERPMAEDLIRDFDAEAPANVEEARKLIEYWSNNRMGTMLDEFRGVARPGGELSLVQDGLRLSARDVGSGISQMVPVVVDCADSQRHCLMVEHPDLHIHPGLHGSLASLFLRSAQDRGHSFLIETHSEHMLLRLMHEIRRARGAKPIAVASMIGVAWIKSEDGTVKLQQMTVDSSGEGFADYSWPYGFFDERLKEMQDD